MKRSSILVMASVVFSVVCLATALWYRHRLQQQQHLMEQIYKLDQKSVKSVAQQMAARDVACGHAVFLVGGCVFGDLPPVKGWGHYVWGSPMYWVENEFIKAYNQYLDAHPNTNAANLPNHTVEPTRALSGARGSPLTVGGRVHGQHRSTTNSP